MGGTWSCFKAENGERSPATQNNVLPASRSSVPLPAPRSGVLTNDPASIEHVSESTHPSFHENFTTNTGSPEAFGSMPTVPQTTDDDGPMLPTTSAAENPFLSAVSSHSLMHMSAAIVDASTSRPLPSVIPFDCGLIIVPCSHSSSRKHE
jgi:hypothetical protein